MTTKSQLRTGLAGLSAAALASSLVVLGSSAAMAEEVSLGPSDIAGYENGDEDDDGYNYDQWHIGSNENRDLGTEEFLKFGECSITVLPTPDGATNSTTQVLKGYNPDARPDSVDAIKEVMNSVKIDADGPTTLQFPFFGHEEGEDTSDWLGTWRTSDSELSETSEMTNSQPDTDNKTFGELIDSWEAAESEGYTYELLGVGFTGSEGTTVDRFSFAGDNVYFGTDCDIDNGDDFDGFTDVSPGYLFHDEIVWIGEQGIAQGWEDGTFRPLNRISREAMAAFLYRWADEPEFDAPEESPFEDVDTDYTFYHEIAWLAEQDIAEGWSDGTFRPLDRISREAMAAFLYRYIDEDYEAPGVSPFKDVSSDYAFYEEIAWMHDQQIAEGWDNGTYRPLNRISREATAAFLYRLDEQENIEAR